MERQKQEYAPTYRRSMTQGVVLCVLAVVPILGTAMLGVPDFWVAAAVGLLLAIVAGAVQLFIRAALISCCKRGNTPSAKSGRIAASVGLPGPTGAL